MKEDELKPLKLPTKLLQLAVAQSGEAVLITDPDGLILYVNPAFEKMTGYNAHEIIGENPRVLKSGQHPKSFYAKMWQTLLSGQSWTGRITNKRKDGELFTEKTIISPMLDEHGDCLAYVAVKQDISRELELEAQLLSAQKMEMVGQLAGGIAHDFNNLLQTVLGYANLIDESLETDNPIRHDLEQIRQAADKAASLTHQMLAFSRRQVIKPEQTNLNELLKKHLRLIKPVMGEHTEINLNLDEALPQVKVDRGQMEQVIMNLCVNARDAMPNGGVLRISSAAIDIDAAELAAEPWLVRGQYVRLRIEDNGEGMQQKTLDHIFEPFFTTKDVGQGSGLGLSSVYGIIKQHQGFISVKSELGRGSQFDILLPLAKGPDQVQANQTEEKPDSGSPDAKGKSPDKAKAAQSKTGLATVLIAEDDDLVRRMVVRILRRNGYNVLIATDGEQALQLFKTCGGAVDACVFDLMMPHMGGHQAASELRKLEPDLPIIFMSGHQRDAHYKEFEQDRQDNFLHKPFRPILLLKLLSEILTAAKSA